MAKYSMETSIIISIVAGLIISNIPIVGIRGLFSIIIVGFVASYLTVPEKTSYKVGALAGLVMAVISLAISFLSPPDLPYTLPSATSLGVAAMANEFFVLILGIIMSFLIYGFLGALGGYLATQFFNPPEVVEKPRHIEKPKVVSKKRSRRTLERRKL
ncbi:MAG: DUF5518 domain-containing protein [Methanobacteriaceae archaeon]